MHGDDAESTPSTPQPDATPSSPAPQPDTPAAPAPPSLPPDATPTPVMTLKGSVDLPADSTVLLERTGDATKSSGEGGKSASE